MSLGERNSKVVMRIENLTKSYESRKESTLVVDDISFEVYEREFLVILGPGHCGKTTLLNIISGLNKGSAGKITVGGTELTKPDRNIGMVFQKLALMPWKTVMENVEFGLKLLGASKQERRETAQKYIDLVGLTGFEKAYPSQLSGGMKQRAGIARAYSCNPEILIMDEPFGQLDAQTRYAMENELLKIWEKEKRTVIFVTNNIEEALYLGDRIILLSKRPASISETYEIDLPRPRDMMADDFIAKRVAISDKMELAL
jgi:NitT/TauT family transport system ATP-binding protein